MPRIVLAGLRLTFRPFSLMAGGLWRGLRRRFRRGGRGGFSRARARGRATGRRRAGRLRGAGGSWGFVLQKVGAASRVGGGAGALEQAADGGLRAVQNLPDLPRRETFDVLQQTGLRAGRRESESTMARISRRGFLCENSRFRGRAAGVFRALGRDSGGRVGARMSATFRRAIPRRKGSGFVLGSRGRTFQRDRCGESLDGGVLGVVTVSEARQAVAVDDRQKRVAQKLRRPRGIRERSVFGRAQKVRSVRRCSICK